MKKHLSSTFFILLLVSINYTNLFALTNSPPFSVWLYPMPASCNSSTGKISANVNGGTAPYNFLWSNGATSQNLLNVPAGTYNLTVYDALGDSANASTTVNTGPIDVLNSYTNAGNWPCPNQCNGIVFFPDSMINGIPPFTISIQTGTNGTIVPNYPNPGTTAITGICHGGMVGWQDLLGVSITDAAGCTGSYWPIGGDGPPVQNPVFTITPACNSLPNGSVTVSNLIGAAWNCGSHKILDEFYNFIMNGTGGLINLPAGNYILETYCSGSGLVNGPCPQYFPFTIPDLGPTCSLVNGKVYLDLNSNCNFDAGEVGVPNTIIEFTPGPYYAYTNNSGDYSTNLPWGTYNINQILSNNLVQICPAQPTSVTLSSLNPNVVIDFADTSNIGLDVKAFLSHGQARPGFDFNYAIGIKNYSHLPSGLLTVTLDYDPLLSFVSANPAPFSNTPGQIVWQLNSLNNFQSTNATVTLNVPANPALIGDTLIATINVSAANPETDLSNNSKTRSHIITGSFDPNEKHVTPSGGILPALNEWIDYTIFFQNTGNDTAFNITIIDTLDANLEVTTFIPGAASHSYETELSGQGIVKFIFNNILLPDSIVDEPNSHGFVSFQIKAKSNLTHNTIISNTADIYFDFNPPIATNTVQNNIDLTLAITASEDVICSGEQTTLEIVNELQNTAWNWYSGSCTGALVGTGNSITVSPSLSTTYFVRDSAGTIPSNNCFFKTITVNPSVDVTTTVNLNIITANAAGASYQWIDCNNNFLPITGEINQSFTATSNGNYAVIVTENSCTDTSACVSIIIIGETEINNSNDFLIYPNPSTGIITIEFNNKEEKEVEIRNVLGDVISKSKSSGLKSEINLSEKAKGVYFIKVIQGNTSKILKIVLM